VGTANNAAKILLKINREFGKSIEWLLTGKTKSQVARR
jgi:hypothetical protein